MKTFKKILILVALFFTFVVGANAIDIVTSSGVWYRNGVNMLLNPPTLQVGSTTTRIAKGWFTDMDISGTLTFSGVMGSDLDMNGYYLEDSSAGILLFRGTGNTNNEDLSFDFETTTNQVAITSTTGVTGLDFGVLETFRDDDTADSFGNTLTAPNASALWETADANANALLTTLPEGGATDVPVFIVGDASALNTDLGLFDGITDPTVAILSDDHSKATMVSHDGTNGVVEATSGSIDIPDATLGLINMPQDGGLVDIMDIAVSAAAVDTTKQGYTFRIDNNAALSLYAYDSANNGNANAPVLQIRAGKTEKAEAIAGADSFNVGDYHFNVDTSGGAYTITLDTDFITDGTPTDNSIAVITDWSGNAGANNITIATEGAETINGAATVTIGANYNTLHIKCNGSHCVTF